MKPQAIRVGVIAGLIVLALATTVVMSTFGRLTSTSAAAPADGSMILGQMTLPRGSVWLAGAQGGHLWVTDSLQGICEVVPAAGATPPWQRSNCQGSVKSGGQVVLGNPPNPAPANFPANGKYVYVADDATLSVNVVRFVFNPATETLSSPLAMRVPNLTSNTQVGGTTTGGRTSGLALAPNGADMYVGYLKSGDLMKITGANTATNATPRVDKVGTTSDGRGVNALVTFGNDLYVAELGGLGLSRIPDPSGTGRPACSATAQCTAASVSPQPSFFPGGLATDGTNIYIGDAPRVSANSILRYIPASGAVGPYSSSVAPYPASFDGKTYSQYAAPFGLGLAPSPSIPGAFDLYASDDPTLGLPLAGQAAPATLQGHIWKIAVAANPLSVASVLNTTAASPMVNTNTGTNLGGDTVSITGTGFDISPNAASVTFGANAATSVVCDTVTHCSATSPAGAGTVDVRVSVAGLISPIATATDQFTFVAPASNAIAVTSLAPSTGVTVGGTTVTITGQNLATFDANGVLTGSPTVSFGANAASLVACTTATTCTAVSPPGGAGVVDVQVTLNGQTSAATGDKFTYAAPTAGLYAWGITAPKGGAVWLPGSLAGSGHWWSSDHAQGMCRQDPVPGSTTLHALNFSACGSDLVGSAGQAVYDPRTNANGTHYVYVPDNAVKSTAVWRLTFNPVTETMVADPLGGTTATPMTPLADVKTLKPNGLAIGPDGNLYVTDLVEPNVRMITNPNGDPRTQVVSIVATTGDLRGANGTQGFIGNRLYISENRGTSFFDVSKCPLAAGPCGTLKIPLQASPAGIFTAGTAVDATRRLVYSSNSPGGANATIFRYDASQDVYVAFLAGTLGANPLACPGCVVGSPGPVLVSGGILPAAGSPEATVWCALSCTRPWDQANHPLPQGGPTGFSFVFGMATDPSGNLVIAEDPSAGARSGRGTMWLVPFIP